MRLIGLVLALSLVLARETKREALHDTPRDMPSIRGGGRFISTDEMIKRGISVEVDEPQVSAQGNGESPGDDVLLETKNVPLPERYIFLTDRRYRSCYVDDREGQGSCNTCWAFATQKMLQARLCKSDVDAGRENVRRELSPLAMICSGQRKTIAGRGICDPESIFVALEYSLNVGLVEGSTMHDRNVLSGPVLDTFRLLGADASAPNAQICAAARATQVLESRHKARRISASAGTNLSTVGVKRTLLRGPVIATMRLTWEFIVFRGSLFNPAGRLTFCRMATAEDSEDYCDPRRRDRWDEAQRAAQDPSSDMDSWYNHFVTLHGWGKTMRNGVDVEYWVVENSWGRIYDNEAALSNNGAGPAYLSSHYDRELQRTLYNKNHFVLIAARISGRSGLAMTSREVYSASL